MFTDGFGIKYDIKDCLLKEVSTGKILHRFDARATEETQKSGRFVGGGIASNSNSFKIATANRYDYQPYNHSVTIDEISYLIIARQPLIKKAVGESYKKSKNEILLTLE